MLFRMTRTTKLALLLGITLSFVLAGCSRAADVNGVWSGSMQGANANRSGSTDIQAMLDASGRGLKGKLACHNANGPWEVLEGNTLTITSGDVSGNRVSFVASANLPGGTVTADFKGKVDGQTLTGTGGVTVGSVMGGDTYLGNFTLTKK